MASRRKFIAAGAVAAAAGLAGFGDAPQPADAAAPKGPSDYALAEARHLQKVLPHAQLDDKLVRKIAGDVDSYDPTAADFRKATLHNWDEPDFVFAAGPKATRR